MYKHIHGGTMFDSKEESLAYIEKHHQEDIKWHKEDLDNKVRRKRYSLDFKITLKQHLRRFKCYQELSKLTGIDVRILKQWIRISNICKRQRENQEFQLLKVCFESSHHHLHK